MSEKHTWTFFSLNIGTLELTGAHRQPTWHTHEGRRSLSHWNQQRSPENWSKNLTWWIETWTKWHYKISANVLANSTTLQNMWHQIMSLKKQTNVCFKKLFCLPVIFADELESCWLLYLAFHFLRNIACLHTVHSMLHCWHFFPTEMFEY